MKLTLLLTTATLLLLGPGITTASEEKPSNPEPTAPTTRAVPIQNYWDANAWDPIGGSLFWHATRDDRPRSKAPLFEGRNTQRRDAKRETATRKPASR